MSKERVIEQLKNDPLMPLRHTAEHVLHTAMRELYPDIKLVMGPPIENGFYFDFDLDKRVSKDDFPKIEEKMQEIIKADLKITVKEVSLEKARDIFKGNQYKQNTLEEIKDRDEKVSICIMGDEKDPRDTDLCMGYHIKKTGDIKAFKLLSVAGAYYKGNEKNKMLQRIYGTAFKSKKDLNKYLENLEKAKENDHRKLGKELDLFTFSDMVGPGLPLWTPKGTVIRRELEKWAEETEKKLGYVRVATPHIGKGKLYETSGHLPYYKDDMYSPMVIDEQEYYLKSMNCPYHHEIFNSQPRSYRDLPLRMAEYGTVYRYEQSGTLFGLMRVRSMAQNDAHIYCTTEQAEKEFLEVIKLHEYYYNTLGLSRDDYYIVMGLQDETKKDKYHGEKEIWDKAEKMMRKAIEKSGIKCVDEIGAAAFYGPKIDFNIISSTGREFSIATNQLDLYMPKTFNLQYTDKDGSKKLCVVIHRAPLGSHERFIGFLIEHYGGAFPVWLSPVQIEIIPISEKHLEYTQKIKKIFEEKDLRLEINDKDTAMGAKIREAQLRKVPYMFILGDKEVANNQLSVRLRNGEQINNLDAKEVLDKIHEIYLTKSLKLW